MLPGTNDHFHINLEDEVTRGAIVLKAGELLWPAPPPPSMAAAQTTTPVPVAKLAPPSPFNETLKDTFMYSTGNTTVIVKHLAQSELLILGSNTLTQKKGLVERWTFSSKIWSPVTFGIIYGQ